MNLLIRFTVLFLLLALSGCAEYYQMQSAQAEATAAPYNAQIAVAEAERDVQIAELDAQLKIVGIQATAQADQVNLLATQAGRSLGILEDAGNRQIDLVQAQYRTMQLNAMLLLAAVLLVIVAGLALAVSLIARRRSSQTVEVRREIVYLPTPPEALPMPSDPPPAIISRADYWRSYCNQAHSQDREA